MMSRRANIFFRFLWGVCVGMLIVALSMLAWYAPVEATQGPIQKIFYPHLGAAIGTLIAAAGVFAGSVGYFWQRDLRWDRLADASARAAAVLLFVVLLTGAIWASRVWGFWWEWSPLLTFSLILWIMYVLYLAVRMVHTSAQRRASISATFGLLATLNVPLVYLSVQFLPSSHLSAGRRAPEMDHTLIVWIAAVILLTVCLIWTHFLAGGRKRSASRDHQDLQHPKMTPAGRNT